MISLVELNIYDLVHHRLRQLPPPCRRFSNYTGFCEVYEEENVSQKGGESGRLFEKIATGDIVERFTEAEMTEFDCPI